MTQLLLRLFIKETKGEHENGMRQRYGTLSGVVGICTNIVLVAGKLAVGLVSGSISIIADAVNNLSDAASSVVTLVGFRMAAKPADREHPFGHARFEYLSGLVVSIMILLIGVELLKSSVDKIIRPEAVNASLTTVIVLLLSVLLKLWQGSFYRTVGKRICSAALMASAADSMSDVISTTAVLVSTVIAWQTGLQLDAYMGLAVAVFILYSGIKMIKVTVGPILGEAPDETLVREIEERIKSYDGVIGMHDLMVHNYGPGNSFASVHVEVDAKEDILKSHDLIDNIEREISRDLSMQLVIHHDPVVTDDPELSELMAYVTGVVVGIDPCLNLHDFRIVRGPTHTNLIFDVVVPCGCVTPHAELADRIAAQIKRRDPNLYAVITIDSSYISKNLPAR